MPVKCYVKTGTMVLLYENSPEEIWALNTNDIGKRLYKVVGLSLNTIRSSSKSFYFGMIVLRHHSEARPASELKVQDGKFKYDEPYIPQRKLSHNQFNAIVEGKDFKITPGGKLARLS